MRLFDRYVHQVGRRLSRQMRADIEAELRSLLIDSLEGRTGRPTEGEIACSEDEQAAILQEFGPPFTEHEPGALQHAAPGIFLPKVAASPANGVPVTARTRASTNTTG